MLLAEKGKAAAAIEDDAVYVWSAICKGAAEALETTPELLPVLKKAGVVDAGGKGLCLILDGILSVFKDNVLIADEMPVKSEHRMRTISSVMLRQSLTKILLSRTVRNLSLAEKKLAQNHHLNCAPI